MTENDIMQALECCCINYDCDSCSLMDFGECSFDCMKYLAQETRELINRQKTELQIMRNYIHDNNLEYDLLSYSKRNGG